MPKDSAYAFRAERLTPDRNCPGHSTERCFVTFDGGALARKGSSKELDCLSVAICLLAPGGLSFAPRVSSHVPSHLEDEATEHSKIASQRGLPYHHHKTVVHRAVQSQVRCRRSPIPCPVQSEIHFQDEIVEQFRCEEREED